MFSEEHIVIPRDFLIRGKTILFSENSGSLMTEKYKSKTFCICRSAYTNNIRSNNSYSISITMNKEAQCKLICVLKDNFGYNSSFKDYHNAEMDELCINGITIKLEYKERTLPGTDIRVQYIVLSGNEATVNEFINMIDSYMLDLFGFEKQLKEIKRLQRDSEYHRNAKYNDRKWEYKKSSKWKKNRIKSSIKEVMNDVQKYSRYINKLDELAEEQYLLNQNAQRAGEHYKWKSEYDYSSNFPEQDEFWKAWYYRKFEDLLLWFDLS